MPIDMTVEVYYDEARTRMLSFHCSFCHPFRQWIEIVGEKKTLSLKDFVLAAAPSSCEFVVEHVSAAAPFASSVEAQRKRLHRTLG